MTFGDGLDAGADDLGRVGAEIDHHGEEGGVVSLSFSPSAGRPKKMKNSCTMNGVLRISST